MLCYMAEGSVNFIPGSGTSEWNLAAIRGGPVFLPFDLFSRFQDRAVHREHAKMISSLLTKSAS
jgi:hypothetical protein